MFYLFLHYSNGSGVMCPCSCCKVWSKLYIYISPPCQACYHVHCFHTFSLRQSKQLVDRTLGKVQHALNSAEQGKYHFLTCMMGQPNLTYKDLIIHSQSLLVDGLTAVGHFVSLSPLQVFKTLGVFCVSLAVTLTRRPLLHVKRLNQQL